MTGPGSNTTAVLRVRGLRYRYPGAGVDALRVNGLELARGDQVLVTGGSGSGKSTLLHLIAGLIDPSEGSVEVGGREIHGMRGAARDRFRGRHVGMIFQTHHLLHGFSAAENVMAALMFSDLPRGEHRARAEGLLRELGIDRVDADPGRMSVGQQQRVAVARAVACGPGLVLADEPTASLDPESGAATVELIQRTCAQHGAALLCVSHDPQLRGRFGAERSMASVMEPA